MTAKTIGAVLRRPIYSVSAVVIAIVLGLLYYFLTLYTAPWSDYVHMVGLPLAASSYTMGFIIAGLAGVNISMIICRKRMTGSFGFRRAGGSSAAGSCIGALGAVCSTCSAGWIAVFPLAAATALLPLYGIELKMLAIPMLVASLYWTSRNVAIACKM